MDVTCPCCQKTSTTKEPCGVEPYCSGVWMPQQSQLLQLCFTISEDMIYFYDRGSHFFSDRGSQPSLMRINV